MPQPMVESVRVLVICESNLGILLEGPLLGRY